MKSCLRYLSAFLFVFVSISSTYAAVVANFTSDKTSGCSPLTVNFTDLSTGGPTSWSWAFGNGNTSNLQNPSAVYNTPGVYSVTLTASDASSSSTIIKTITVHTNPVAGFSLVANPHCVGSPVLFSDNSTLGSAPISTWSWDYGDGNNQNTVTGSASHVYTATGTYPVSLIITDGNGCTGSAVGTLTIVPAPVANFSATPTSSCIAPLAVSFTNTSSTSGSVSYSWTFGDGGTSTSQNPVHTYTANGTYNVTLVITQGSCKDTIVKNNYIVVNKIVANFTVASDSVCTGSPASFTETSTPLSTSRTWSFGDGATSTSNNPTHAYAAPGVYTVTLVATDASGCKDTIIKNNFITVLPAPVASFGSDVTNGCSIPFTVNFADSSAGAVAWSWNFGDGSATSTSQNPAHTYTATGTYTVSLIITATNGCTAQITKNAYIFISKPVVDFTGTPLQGCIPLLVNFTSTSTSAADPIATYIWTFGDGNTLTTAATTAANTYTAQGVYSVKLKIITASGCTDSTTKINYVRCGVKPVANFTYAPSVICYGQTVQFTDQTNIADQWNWTFGDGGTSTQQNPTRLYADTGLFSVTLIAINNGCPDTVIKTDIITVKPPIPRFTYTLSCTDYYTVKFTNTSAAADSITWAFGDATSDVTNNNTPTHTYATRGVKTVTLTAFNSSTACSFTVTHSFTIAEPIADYTVSPDPAKGCTPLVVSFTSTSQDANTYLWDFNNGATSSAINPTATYLSKGIYTPTLTITDVNGCTDAKSYPNLVNALAIDDANFTASPTTGCVPLTVMFADSSTSDSLLTTWIWNWGDGSTSTLSTPTASHTYTLSGFYTVTLTIQDTSSCSRTVIKSNFINPTKPVPSFSVDTFACRNEVVLFDASASSVAAPAVYSWSFGDGNTFSSATATTSYSYSVDAVYAVTLTVTDKNGCDSTIVKNVRVQQPVAAFTDSTLAYGCGTKQVKFTDKSTGFVNAWNWNFGNGAGSSLQNPSYTYTSPGTFSVTLIVTNIGGCTDTLVVDSMVVPGPIGTFSFSPAAGCVPLTVTFHASSSNADYFTWDFGDGTVLTKTLLTTVVHTYSTNISVTPILLIGDTLPNGLPCELPATNLTGGVVATTLLNVTVAPASPISITEEEAITLEPSVTGNITNILGYTWTPATGLSCSDCENPLLTGLGYNMQYVLTVTDVGAGGCIGYDTVDVIYVPCVASVTAPNVFTPNFDGFNDVFTINGVCIGTDYSLIIYDRWGVEIFKTNQRRTFWDGRNTSGEMMPEGVYYYVIMLDGTPQKGFVHIIR